uniref:Uncharacterized protein n=1 Tax=Anopheles merus TaxID=30066 RepID=A0A182V5F1_ANOME
MDQSARHHEHGGPLSCGGNETVAASNPELFAARLWHTGPVHAHSCRIPLATRIDGASGMFTAKTSALQLPHGAKYPGAGCSFALRHRYQNGTGSVAEPTRPKGLHANSEHVLALGIGSERPIRSK